MARSRMLAAITNALLLTLETAALTAFFISEGPAMWRYYTECSNTLAAISALVCLVHSLNGPNDGGSTLAMVARRLKFIACCTQLMTLVVVALVLVPMINLTGGNGLYQMFLVGGRPITHLVGPLLTLASYLSFESEPLPTRRDSALALTPTVLYAICAYAGNYLRVLVGPYPFFQVWDMPLGQTFAWFVALLIVAYLLAQVPRVMAMTLRRKGGRM